MRKRKLISGAIIISVFSALGVCKFCFSEKNTPKSNSDTSPPEIIQPVQASESNKKEKKEKPKKQGYEIKEYKGNIAVFESGEKKPFRVTEIEVKNLPEADRKELKSGIEAPNDEKLTELLEDYLS